MYNQSYENDYGQREDDNLKQRIKDPLLAVVRWLKKRSPREKMMLMGIGAVLVGVIGVRCECDVACTLSFTISLC